MISSALHKMIMEIIMSGFKRGGASGKQVFVLSIRRNRGVKHNLQLTCGAKVAFGNMSAPIETRWTRSCSLVH